jgi:hypothetical protein
VLLLFKKKLQKPSLPFFFAFEASLSALLLLRRKGKCLTTIKKYLIQNISSLLCPTMIQWWTYLERTIPSNKAAENTLKESCHNVLLNLHKLGFAGMKYAKCVVKPQGMTFDRSKEELAYTKFHVDLKEGSFCSNNCGPAHFARALSDCCRTRLFSLVIHVP